MPTRGTPPLPPSSSRGLTGLKDITCWLCGDLGLKDKTCWYVVTFRLVDAGKSVLEVVGANVKDGQNVLVCGDFSACWCGKVGIGGGCFIASLCVVP